MPNIYAKNDEQREPERAPHAIMVVCQNGFRFVSYLSKGKPYRTQAEMGEPSKDLPSFLRQLAAEMEGIEPIYTEHKLSISPSADGYVAYINWTKKEKQDG